MDETEGYVDMSHRVVSPRAGVFSLLKDKSVFSCAYVDYGVVTWPCEVDLAPDTMYENIKEHGEWVLAE